MDVSEILAELDDHGFADTSTGRKMAEVNDAYFDACSRHAWPFLLSWTTTTTWDATTNLVSNFPATYGKPLAFWTTSTGRPIRQIRMEEAMRRLAPVWDATGHAQFWWTVGPATTIFLWPKPPNGTPLRMAFLKKPNELLSTDVEATILIPPHHHRILIAGALTKLYVMEDDPELAAAFNGEFEQRINTMANEYLLVPNEYPVEAPEGGGETDASGNDRSA